MNYEWDENKRISNLKKHGLNFEEVKYVFESSPSITLNSKGNYGEERFFTIGLLANVVVVIVHTKRNETTRIISFRHANRKEREVYYGNCKNDKRGD
jgi:uncharacterized DUF497 family protein